MVLFDIDGTLLRRAGPHHRTALVDAVEGVTGLAVSIDGIAVQGMLDRDIIALAMRAAGANAREVRDHLPRIMKRAQWLYGRRCPDLSRKVCPGARGALERLRRQRTPLGLVTGNLSRIGWKKMERAGLRPYFRFGVFAEEGHTRTALARLALTRARREGWISRDSVVALVGDHPNDILAASATGVRSIAVATGLSPEAELAAHEPDYLLATLNEFRLSMISAAGSRNEARKPVRTM